MAKITLAELNEESLLKEKLEANQKEIEEARKELNQVIEQQAEILRRKIEKYVPIMKFIRSQGYYMSNPKVSPRSARGAVLDYDEYNDNVYVYEVESGWIKEINLRTEKTKSVLYPTFVAERNLENALAGLDYLLVIQDKIKSDFEEEKAKREQWLKENEGSL